MNTLANFPLVNQLSEPSVDGSDENTRNNCVAASIAAALTYLLGRPFNGDQLKDAVYGEAYTGPMAASQFVTYLSKLGVRLSPVSANQATLVSDLHSYLKQGIPCLVTMPSQWAVAPADPVHPSGSTHVGVACGEAPGSIRVMNPWGGFFQDQSDAWWQARLCFGQIWLLERRGDFPVLDISQTGGYFTLKADGSWACKNGHDLNGGILAFYRNNAGFRLFGLPLTPYLHPETGYAGCICIFERGAIAYDPSHKWDRVPTEPDASCYAAHIDRGFVLDHLSAAIADQLSKANAALSAANVQVNTLTKQLAAAQASLSQAQSERDAAKQQEADIQAKLNLALQNQSDAQNAVTVLKKAMGL